MNCPGSRPAGTRWGLLSFMAALALILVFFALYDPFEATGPNLVPEADFEPSAWAQGMPSGRVEMSALARWRDDAGHEGSGGLEIGAGRGRVEWVLENPTDASHVRVSGRLRVVGVKPGSYPWSLARLVLFWRDEHGRSRWDYPHIIAQLSGTRDWGRYEATLKIPPAARSGHLVVQHVGSSGWLFVDDLQVLAARQKPIFPWLRHVLLALWCTTFLYALWELAPWRRRGGLVVVGLAVAIVVGVAAPAESFEHLVRWQGKVLGLIDDAFESMTASAPEAHSQTTDVRPQALPKPPAASARLAPVLAGPVELAGAVDKLKKSGHAVLFGLLGLTAALSYLGTQPRVSPFGLAMVLLLFAAATELLQFTVADRGPNISDWTIDALGLTASLIVAGPLLSAAAWWRTRCATPEGKDQNTSP